MYVISIDCASGTLRRYYKPPGIKPFKVGEALLAGWPNIRAIAFWVEYFRSTGL